MPLTLPPSSNNAAWRPHPGAQTDFLSRGEYEVLYGGAAGGGKTDCLVMAAARYVQHKRYHGLLLRRTFPQLQEVIDRSRHFYPLLGGEWRATEHRWAFPSGAIISMGHIQHEGDEYNYQGKEYQFVGFDELTQFSEKQYLYLFSRLRSSAGLRSLVRATTNPGGPGHEWVKRRFRIGVVEPRTTIYDDCINPVTGELYKVSRVFIPGKLDDNPTLTRNDPLYVQRLLQLPELERQRLLYGIWDAFEGQAFGELNRDIHAFNFDIPAEWEVFGSFDWGSAKPWHYGLYAVDFDGNIWMFAEIYGAEKQQGEFLDKGLRLNDVEIARMILDLEREMNVHPRYRVADPAIWSTRPKKDGPAGPSPEETMRREGVSFIKADNNRIAGRREFHNRLRLDEDTGKPSFYVHMRCSAFWQTIPLLVEDPRNPEDILSKDTPDHPYDSARYAIMSRPMRPKHTKRPDTGSFQFERRRLLDAQKRARQLGISLESAYRR